jgi:RimJ/RimL family protein N-acetyltransferase
MAIIDKTQPASAEDDAGELAGMLSYLNTPQPTAHLSTEIGGVVILPSYQRTYITTNAVGLMLFNAFDTVHDGGLDLRHIEWRTSTMNPASARFAETMGFRRERVLR